MSDSVNHHRTFEILTAEPVQSRKPRHWTDEEKAQLVADAPSPGPMCRRLRGRRDWTRRNSMRGVARRFRREWLRH